MSNAADFVPVSRPRRAVEAITVGASPYTYMANAPGFVAISGGTITTVTLSRDSGGTTTDFGLTSGFFPVAAFDQIAVTYTGAPTMNFLPA